MDEFKKVEEFEYLDAFDEGVDAQYAASRPFWSLDMDRPHFVHGKLVRRPPRRDEAERSGVIRLSYYLGQGKMVVE